MSSRVIQDIRQGSGESTLVLARLGLSFAHLAALSREDQFLEIGDRLSKIAGPGRRTALAMEALSKPRHKRLEQIESDRAGTNQNIVSDLARRMKSIADGVKSERDRLSNQAGINVAGRTNPFEALKNQLFGAARASLQQATIRKARSGATPRLPVLSCRVLQGCNRLRQAIYRTPRWR